MAHKRTGALRVTRDAKLRMGKARFGYESAYGDGIRADPSALHGRFLAV